MDRLDKMSKNNMVQTDKIGNATAYYIEKKQQGSGLGISKHLSFS